MSGDRRLSGDTHLMKTGSDDVSTIGELSDIGVGDLIDIMTRRNRTGRLAVKVGGHEVHLYFENGTLSLVSSTDITLRIGRMLIRQGLLDTPRLLEALHAQAETGNRQPLGAILLARGWITEPDLARCIEEQSIELLAKTVGDQVGMFVFEADVARPSHVQAAALDPDVLLTAAKERTDALRLLREQLPSPGTPLFLGIALNQLTELVEEIGTPEALVVDALRTGAKSLSELSFHLALDELSLGVAVLTLIERGVIVTEASRAATVGRPNVRAAAS